MNRLAFQIYSLYKPKNLFGGFVDQFNIHQSFRECIVLVYQCHIRVARLITILIAGSESGMVYTTIFSSVEFDL